MKYNILAFFIGLILMGCEPNSSVSTANKTNKEGFSKSDMIRMPVSADQPLDTSLVAKLDFEETVYDFGTVLEGKQVSHVFKFKNTGKVPLLISDAKATCGCTVPNYPKDPIPPGESGEVSVKFNTSGKKNDQNKPVTLIANTFPQKTVLNMRGFVQPNPQLKKALENIKQ